MLPCLLPVPALETPALQLQILTAAATASGAAAPDMLECLLLLLPLLLALQLSAAAAMQPSLFMPLTAGLS